MKRIWNKMLRKANVPVKRDCDNESLWIWERLRFLDDTSCCRSVQYMKDEFDCKLNLLIGRELVKTIPINYCPGCGRKLK